MSRYDGLIIPRSYSEYINKTDAATLQQALQQSGVLSDTVQSSDNKAVKSDAVNTAFNTRLAPYAKGAAISHSNNYYAKLKITISAPYTTSLIALHARGGATCLVAVCAGDSGNANIALVNKVNGDYIPTFYKKAISPSEAELYWVVTAYSIRSNYQILTNNQYTYVETGQVQTLPEGATEIQ